MPQLIDCIFHGTGETMPRCPNSLRIFSVVWAALKNIAHELAIDSFVRFGLGSPTDETHIICIRCFATRDIPNLLLL